MQGRKRNEAEKTKHAKVFYTAMASATLAPEGSVQLCYPRYRF